MGVRAARLPTVAVADAAVLVGLRPHVGRLVDGLGAPHAWFARTGVDGALGELAAAALWVVAAWLALGLLVLALARADGTAGRVGARLARLVLPRVVRVVLAGSAAGGVLLAPVAAGAHGVTATGVPGGAQPSLASAVPAAGVQARVQPPDGIGAPAVAPRTQPSLAAAVPSPAWPIVGDGPPGGRTDPVPGPAWPTGGSHPLPTPVWPVDHRPQGAGGTGTVTVRPGDSLWLIAARRLGADADPAAIAAAWPRWYAANRDAIGADPALLVPGRVLHAPATVTEESR